jgi:hypothetical protein
LFGGDQYLAQVIRSNWKTIGVGKIIHLLSSSKKGKVQEYHDAKNATYSSGCKLGP